ncbi:MAG: hypothetical protein JXA11_14440, partial [Phycisphaerae bacterium]|nr:hypothetical protein [Phycisphaerae bacterium]
SITAACGEPTGHKKKPPPEAAMIYPRTQIPEPSENCLTAVLDGGNLFSGVGFSLQIVIRIEKQLGRKTCRHADR